MPDTVNAGGISGFIDLPQRGASFQCQCFGFNESLTVNTLSLFGRGDTSIYGGGIPLTASGSIAIIAKSALTAQALAVSWEGAEGTLTLTEMSGKTQTVNIVVVGATITNLINAKSDDPGTRTVHKIGLTCQISSTPTFNGYGDAVTIAPMSADSQQQYAGTSITSDANALATNAGKRFIAWGAIADTDADDLQWLADTVTAATIPITGLKKRPATFRRLGLYAAEIIVPFGLTDTKDDVELPTSAASYSPITLESGQEATVIAFTGNRYDGVAAIAAANFTDKLFEDVDLKNLTGAQAMQIIKKMNADKLMTTDRFHTAEDSVKARVAFWGDDEGKVFVYDLGIAVFPSDPPDRGAGSVEVDIQSLAPKRTRGYVHLVRRFIIAPEDLHLVQRQWLLPQFNGRGTTNAQKFLDWEPHTLMYSVGEIEYNVTIADCHLCKVNYLFMYDSLQHYDDSLVPVGRDIGVRPDATNDDTTQVLINTTGLKPTHWFATHTPVITWPVEADYDVFLDDIECSAAGGDSGGNPPIADFIGVPEEDEAFFTFWDISGGGPGVSWLWNFGDGDTSTEQNPIHTYTIDGTFTVELTVTNADGSDTETKTNYITVGAGGGGGGAFEFTSTASHSLENANDFTPQAVPEAGDNGTADSVIFWTGALEANIDITGDNTVTSACTFDGETSFNGTMDGGGSIIKGGTGTTLLINVAGTWTGGTTINDGIVLLGGGDGSVPDDGLLTINGGTFDIGAESQSLNAGFAMGGSAIIVGDGGDLSISATIASTGTPSIKPDMDLRINTAVTFQVDSGTMTVSQGMDENPGPANLYKAGTGTLKLSDQNSFTGFMLIYGGIVQQGISQCVVDTMDMSLGLSTTNGTFDLNGFDCQVSTIDMNGTGPSKLVTSTGGAAMLTLNPTADFQPVATGADPIYGGSLSITKAGSNIYQFSSRATNAYTGSTTISAGVFQLGGSNSIPAASAIAVASGASFDMMGFSDSSTSAGLVVSSGGKMFIAGGKSLGRPTTIAGAAITVVGAGTATWSYGAADAIRLTANATVTIPVGSLLLISGSGTLEKAGFTLGGDTTRISGTVNP